MLQDKIKKRNSIKSRLKEINSLLCHYRSSDIHDYSEFVRFESLIKAEQSLEIKFKKESVNIMIEVDPFFKESYLALYN